MERVVVAFDLTEESGLALPWARAIAGRAGARLEPVVVSCPGAAGTGVAEARAYLEEHGLPDVAPVIVEADEVAPALAGLARAPATTMCMASHGRTRWGELLLGSVADRVLALGGPLVLVGPAVTAQPELGTLIVCVDGSARAGELLAPATSWIRDLRLMPVVVQVVEPGRERATAMAVQRVAAELSEDAPGGGPPLRLEELHGKDAGPTIARFVQGERGGLLMVAAATTGRWARLVAGSTTAELVRRAPVPVIAIPVDAGVT